MNEIISILLIESNAAERIAFTNMAAHEKLPYRTEMAETVADARRALAARSYDLILAASKLPDGDPFDLLDLLRDQLVIFTTGSGDEETAIRALSAGLRDYIIKDPDQHYLRMLPHRIEISRRQWLAERELRAREERHRAILDSTLESVKESLSLLEGTLESTADGILVADGHGNIVRFNRKFAEMWQLPAAVLVSGNDDDALQCVLAQLNEPEQFLNKVRELYSQPAATSFDLLTFKDGRVFERYSQPQRLKENIVGRVWSFRDVTARKRAEQALEMMRLSVDRAGDSIFWISREGRILYVNDAACEGRGYSREELLGMNVFDLDPDYQTGVWEPHFEDLKRRGAITLETRHRTKDGRVFPVEVNANYVYLNEHEFNFCFARDITLRKQNEEEIRRLAAFPQVNPNPVLELTAEGSIHYHNAAAVALARELGCNLPGEMLPPGAMEIVAECLATRASRSRVETPFGNRIVSWSFYPIPDRGIVHCYANEVTEQRELAEQLRQVQKMESVGQLAAGIAHDFNNLLTVIQGYSDVLRGQLTDRPLAAECVEQIAGAGERAAGLTRQLLLFSRKQVAQRRLFDLNELTCNLAKMLRRILGEEIELRLQCWTGLPPVLADPGMIEQIITNLSVNARDAMPTGGRLEIATSVAELDAARVRSNPEAKPGRFVCLAVSDTGAGVAPENLAKIFEPFFTTKEVGKGTGLGLATVYGIVMQHQGVVDIISQPGQGAQFRIYLPINSPAQKTAADTAKAAPPLGGAETVLLVEDEDLVLSLVEMLLKQAGYRVLTARTGVAAQQVWQENPAEIDLLLTDMVMPESLNGKQLAERLKAKQPGLRVIFMSGYSPDLRAGDLGLEEGLNFLQKPFTGPKLLQAVRRQLDYLG